MACQGILHGHHLLIGEAATAAEYLEVLQLPRGRARLGVVVRGRAIRGYRLAPGWNGHCVESHAAARGLLGPRLFGALFTVWEAAAPVLPRLVKEGTPRLDLLQGHHDQR